jgi:hypothetical protein
MAATTAMILGAASMAASAGGSAMSFLQAGKQAKLQRQAELDAAKALQEAKRQISVNPFEALGIQKEPYELERQALLSQGAQGIQAAQEADRGAAAAVGRIQMAQNEAQAGQRAAMQQEMSNLEKMTAQEQSDIQANLATINLEEAKGSQAIAKEAREARAKSIEQGYQSAVGAVKTGIETFMPLYLKQGGGAPQNIQKAGMAAGAAGATSVAGAAAKGMMSPISANNNAGYNPFDYNQYNSGDYNYFINQ